MLNEGQKPPQEKTFIIPGVRKRPTSLEVQGSPTAQMDVPENERPSGLIESPDERRQYLQDRARQKGYAPERVENAQALKALAREKGYSAAFESLNKVLERHWLDLHKENRLESEGEARNETLRHYINTGLITVTGLVTKAEDFDNYQLTESDKKIIKEAVSGHLQRCLQLAPDSMPLILDTFRSQPDDEGYESSSAYQLLQSLDCTIEDLLPPASPSSAS